MTLTEEEHDGRLVRPPVLVAFRSRRRRAPRDPFDARLSRNPWAWRPAVVTARPRQVECCWGRVRSSPRRVGGGGARFWPFGWYGLMPCNAYGAGGFALQRGLIIRAESADSAPFV